jgi:hypothetical protein
MIKVNKFHKIFLFTLVIISCCGGCSNDNQVEKTTKQNSQNKPEIPSNIRYDGLYQSETEGNIRNFLRFYSDGTVLEVGTTAKGEIKDIIKWFKKPFDKPYYSKGKFEIKMDKIYFAAISSYGTVLYEGIIENENKLRLKIKSLINGNESEEVFYFIKI